jgi:hypothetical protein
VWSVAAQVACSATFSIRFLCVLVPRNNSTPVAKWPWPTWVVELEKSFGQAVFDLLEKPSPSRIILIGS